MFFPTCLPLPCFYLYVTISSHVMDIAIHLLIHLPIYCILPFIRLFSLFFFFFFSVRQSVIYSFSYLLTHWSISHLLISLHTHPVPLYHTLFAPQSMRTTKSKRSACARSTIKRLPSGCKQRSDHSCCSGLVLRSDRCINTNDVKRETKRSTMTRWHADLTNVNGACTGTSRFACVLPKVIRPHSQQPRGYEIMRYV